MPTSHKRLSVLFASAALAVSVLSGCATGTNPRDPFETVNRKIYDFNEAIDRTYLQPTAYVYRTIVPQFVRASVSNFFSNINDIIVGLNNLLQGKFTAAYSDLGRIAMNSTLGIGGLFDVASEAGIERHEEDFGQTLGVWGVGDGPYLVLPLFGPSNARDAVGRVADYKADLVGYVDPVRARNQLWGTRIVNRRSELLDASTVLQTAALDPYEFVRDAYMQRRRNLIYDGAPPMEKELLDPPAAPKRSRATEPTFPSAAEPTGSGSVLVSGETRIPVISASQYENPAAVSRPRAWPAAAGTSPVERAVPAETTADNAAAQNGDTVTAPWPDSLDQPQQSAATHAQAAPRAPTMLVRLWRSIVH